MSRRSPACRAIGFASVIAALAGCDSPYQRQGILSDEVAHRLSTSGNGDLSALGEVGPLPAPDLVPPSPEDLAGLEPGQRSEALDLASVRAAVLENNLGI